MEVNGKIMADGHSSNVIYLSSILGRDNGANLSHKCDWKCQNEHLCGNIYRCRLTGLTHICDKNCNQRILYDNHSSLCRVSRHVFPLSPVEEQAVRGVRRKLDGGEYAPPEGCNFKHKHKRNGQCSPYSFERAVCGVVGPVFSQVGDGMDMS
ncbi:hypothetical protein RJ641_007837 [Dillenia turbinata]|uniref:Uncharacterized protein n=1 Tax=Dillenia turbinata TaxID=194707 RepID=A0AAN8ZA73_9MAGN